MAEEIGLLVGLGNPGSRFEGTRHNVGFRAVDKFVDARGGSWEPPAVGKGLVAKLDLDGRRLWAAKPHTYMNASGDMVAPLARYYKVVPAGVLVVSDDFNLPLGRLRLRMKGSAGGQKGLDSILRLLGTQEVPRLRLGVGPVPGRQDPADFVLGRFRKEERDVVEEMAVKAAKALSAVFERGILDAMNEYNKPEA